MKNVFTGASLMLTLACATPSLAQAPAAPTGRFGAVMEYDASVSPAQTVYRPRDLGSGDVPIVAWGNGGCAADGGAESRPFLMQLASEGYLIIAPGKPGPDPRIQPTTDRIDLPASAGTRPPGPPPAAGSPPPRPPGAVGVPAGPAATAQRGNWPSNPGNLIAAIDWAQKENARSGSIYYGKLSATKIAVMGRSCGGMQTLAVQSDPRIVTSMVWNSGAFDQPQQLGGGMVLTKDTLKTITKPIAFIAGGPTDMAHANAVDDVKRINNVPLFFGEISVGHGGTMAQENGGSYARVGKAWLDWRLKGDVAAARMFVGADCTLCQDKNWTVVQRNLK